MYFDLQILTGDISDVHRSPEPNKPLTIVTLELRATAEVSLLYSL